MYRKAIFVLIVTMMFSGVASAFGSGFTDYGNGVLYFHKSLNTDRPEAGYLISQYLTEHPEKHIVSISPDAYVGYGSTGGFYVIVENKSVNKMDCTPVWNGNKIGTTAIVNYICIME